MLSLLSSLEEGEDDDEDDLLLAFKFGFALCNEKTSIHKAGDYFNKGGNTTVEMMLLLKMMFEVGCTSFEVPVIHHTLEVHLALIQSTSCSCLEMDGKRNFRVSLFQRLGDKHSSLKTSSGFLQALKLVVMIGSFNYTRSALEKEMDYDFPLPDFLMVGKEEFGCSLSTSKNLLSLELKQLMELAKVLVQSEAEDIQEHKNKLLEEFILIESFWKRKRAFMPFKSCKTLKVCFDFFRVATSSLKAVVHISKGGNTIHLELKHIKEVAKLLALFAVEDKQKFVTKFLEEPILKECVWNVKVYPMLKHAENHGKGFCAGKPCHEVVDENRLKNSWLTVDSVFIHVWDMNESLLRVKGSLEVITGVMSHSGSYCVRIDVTPSLRCLHDETGKEGKVKTAGQEGKLSSDTGIGNANLKGVIHDKEPTDKHMVLYPVVNKMMVDNKGFLVPRQHKGVLSGFQAALDGTIVPYVRKRVVSKNYGTCFPFTTGIFENAIERIFCPFPAIVHCLTDNGLCKEYARDNILVRLSRQTKGDSSQHTSGFHGKGEPSRAPMLQKMSFLVRWHLWSSSTQGIAQEVPAFHVLLCMVCPPENVPCMDGPTDNTAMFSPRQEKVFSFCCFSADFKAFLTCPCLLLMPKCKIFLEDCKQGLTLS